jgi:response regulator of citrate/malate metabolism
VIGVLLVDDDPLTLELHRAHVAKVEGFEVVGECAGARAAVAAILDRAIRERTDPRTDGEPAIDLVLLDVTMPDGNGLEVLRHIRAHANEVDVIAITGVRDAETVHSMAALGVTHYLVKPFPFSVLRERLEQVREYRERSAAAAGDATQAEIDAILRASRPRTTATLPKGLSPASLERVAAAVREHGPLSALEAATATGLSRVAVRRYLEHLADAGRVERDARYGTVGRPETEYRWR